MPYVNMAPGASIAPRNAVVFLPSRSVCLLHLLGFLSLSAPRPETGLPLRPLLVETLRHPLPLPRRSALALSLLVPVPFL